MSSIITPSYSHLDSPAIGLSIDFNSHPQDDMTRHALTCCQATLEPNSHSEVVLSFATSLSTYLVNHTKNVKWRPSGNDLPYDRDEGHGRVSGRDVESCRYSLRFAPQILQSEGRHINPVDPEQTFVSTARMPRVNTYTIFRPLSPFAEVR